MLPIKEIQAAKPKAKPYKLSDGDGLYIEVMPTGSKYWRLKYRVAGKEKRLALGVFPEVRPPEARTGAQKAREQLRAGIDPSEQRKAVKQAKILAGANTFEIVANEWMNSRLAPLGLRHTNRNNRAWLQGNGKNYSSRRTTPKA